MEEGAGVQLNSKIKVMFCRKRRDANPKKVGLFQKNG